MLRNMFLCLTFGSAYAMAFLFLLCFGLSGCSCEKNHQACTGNGCDELTSGRCDADANDITDCSNKASFPDAKCKCHTEDRGLGATTDPGYSRYHCVCYSDC